MLRAIIACSKTKLKSVRIFVMWKIKVLIENRTDKEKDTVRFAAQELRRYLGYCTTEPIIISEVSKEDNSGIILGIKLRSELKPVKDEVIHDSILIDVKERNGVISGSNARSVLIAAYRYLRELGYSFVRPGKSGEKYPEKLPERDVFVSESAFYSQRTICIEGSASYESIEETIDWIPKVGMSGFYTQFFIPKIFFDRWYRHYGYEFTNPYLNADHLSEEEIRGMIKMLVCEIRKRSLIYTTIGHGWMCEPFGMPGYGWEPVDPALIPKGIEKYLALRNGKREIYNDNHYKNVPLITQLCYGNPEVREIIIDFVIEYCRNNPDVYCISFDFADGSNNYCECPLCRDTTPSDFRVMIVNEIDRRLTAEGIETKIGFGAYNDTLWAPVREKINNLSRFLMSLAPISRSYSVEFPNEPKGEIGEFRYNKNVFPTTTEEFLPYLKEWRKALDTRVGVFDYYFMWDCYKDLGSTGTARIIHKDIRSYKKLDLCGLTSCQSERVYCPTALGMNVIARTLWDPETDFDAIREDVLKAEYGEDYALVRDYLEDLTLYSLPEVTRMEKPLVSEENALTYEKGIDRARKFNLIIQNRIETVTNECELRSWKNLKVHTALSIMLMSAFRDMARGAEPADFWPPIEDFVNRHEWEMRQHFDVFEFKYTYGRLFPKIKEGQKSLILGM